ncbi:MAG TPA: hypothetical protein VMT38_08050 [Terracidiphilus sp.]|nr:hypothetical protein [Terracidiphilus sp.]
MKLAAFLGCVLLVAPLGIAAQNASYGVAGMENMTPTGPDGQTTSQTIALPNPCPVSVEASHLSDGNVVRTGAGQFQIGHDPINRPQSQRLPVNGAKGVGQWLHLKLKSPDARTIDSAALSLRGYTATGRTEQLGPAKPTKETTLKMQTLTVYLIPGADHTSTVDVWASGLTAVVSVELLSVKYSDGSTWTPAEGNSCRVAPDHLMLITQR